MMLSESSSLLDVTTTGKVDAAVTADLRAAMDVDAGEEARDDGLKVQVGGRL
jgi:hypothetical protein